MQPNFLTKRRYTSPEHHGVGILHKQAPLKFLRSLFVDQRFALTGIQWEMTREEIVLRFGLNKGNLQITHSPWMGDSRWLKKTLLSTTHQV
jgi:hypothetical protein